MGPVGLMNGPRIVKTAHISHVGPYMEIWRQLFPACKYVCSVIDSCHEIVVPLYLTQGSPKITKTDMFSYFVSSLYLTRTLICMGTSISCKQDGSIIPIIQAPQGWVIYSILVIGLLEFITSLCHSNGHIETMPAREINPFAALIRIRSQFLRTQ